MCKAYFLKVNLNLGESFQIFFSSHDSFIINPSRLNSGREELKKFQFITDIKTDTNILQQFLYEMQH